MRVCVRRACVGGGLGVPSPGMGVAIGRLVQYYCASVYSIPSWLWSICAQRWAEEKCIRVLPQKKKPLHERPSRHHHLSWRSIAEQLLTRP